MFRIAALCLPVLALSFAAACTNTKLPSLSIAPAPGNIALGDNQRAAVHAGVRKMIPNPDTAKFLADGARKGKADEGTHVCGHVTYVDPATSKSVEQPYYVELRVTNGVPNAERGQVGGDPAKLAKVKFLCRDHRL